MTCTFSLQAMAEVCLKPELVYQQVQMALNERKVLKAYDLWEQAVSKTADGWASLPNYNETTARLKQQRSLLNLVFTDTKKRSDWVTMEKYTQCADFLSIEYSYKSHAGSIKMRADFEGGELNITELATLMRDIVVLPRISPLFSTEHPQMYERFFTTAAVVSVKSKYPGLWNTGSKQVSVNFYDCMEEHGAIAVCYDWDQDDKNSIKNIEPNTLTVLMFPARQRMTIYLHVRRPTTYLSTEWMDRNFICYNLHPTVISLVDMSRKLNLLDPDMAETIDRMWAKNSMEPVRRGSGLGGEHEYDSEFFQWVQRALRC